jgi:hypothetical protein
LSSMTDLQDYTSKSVEAIRGHFKAGVGCPRISSTDLDV